MIANAFRQDKGFIYMRTHNDILSPSKYVSGQRTVNILVGSNSFTELDNRLTYMCEHKDSNGRT
jgi:hypothetical protein